MVNMFQNFNGGGSVKLIAMIMVSVFVLSTVGCLKSSYQSHTEYKSTKAIADAVSRPKALRAITSIVSDILDPLESAVRGKYVQANTNTYLLKNTYIDGAGNEVTFTVGDIVTPIVNKFLDRDIAIARANAIQYLTPIVEAIYKDSSNDNAPMTAAQVFSKLMDNIPIMTTVLGMYGLGVGMVDKVGDNIAMELNDSTFVNRGNLTEASGGAAISFGPGDAGGSNSPTEILMPEPSME